MKFHSTLFGSIFGLVMANSASLEAVPTVIAFFTFISAMVIEGYSDRKLKKKREMHAIFHGLSFFIMCFVSGYLFMDIFTLSFLKLLIYSFAFAILLAYAPIRFDFVK